MKAGEKKAAIVGLVGNAFLFASKLALGLLTNSLAIISDAINSGTDIIASFVVYKSIKTASEAADDEHQFGHARAEPIAALIVAIFTGLLGFQVMVMAIQRLLNGAILTLGASVMGILIFTILLKGCMHAYAARIAKETKSVAIAASAMDHRNDAIISSAALIGVGAAYFGYPLFDSIFALAIGGYIVMAGYKIGQMNINYLMGGCPDGELMDRIKKAALSVKGVTGLNDARAHYIGTEIQVEIHVEMNKRMSLEKAHAIGKQVQWKIEAIKGINRAFVHIDPR